jgi:ParB family transcriptional regulator, chromosome partitioning protein
MKKKSLGQGLSALIGDSALSAIADDNIKNDNLDNNNSYILLEINKLIPNKLQPRKKFIDSELDDLAESIKQNGVLLPILVRKTGDNFEIIAGERRWRAAKMVGLKNIPAIIKNVEEKVAFEIALIENIQRSDLTAMEEAEGYLKLINEYSYKQEDLSKIVGKSRSHISNLLRLLNLPKDVQENINNGEITTGHGKLLVNNYYASEFAKQIIENNLSVREAEKLIQKGWQSEKSDKKIARKIIETDEDITQLEKLLEDSLGTKVKIKDNASGGQVIINFYNLEQLDLILQKLSS